MLFDSRNTSSPRVQRSWWKGSHGEWLVAVQVILIGLVFLGPRTVFGRPRRPFPFPEVCSVVGILFMAGGSLLFFTGLLCLGRGLTPLPYPKEGVPLIQTGPYALVRHPMYSGGLLLALGWALFIQGWLTLGYVALLFLLLDIKSRREERWLTEKFSDYAAYQRRVRKLIPFIF